MSSLHSFLFDMTAVQIAQEGKKKHGSKTAHRAQFTFGSGGVLPEIKIQTAAQRVELEDTVQGNPEKCLLSSALRAEHQAQRISGSQWAQPKRLSGWRWKATHYFLLHHHPVAHSWGPWSCGELFTVQGWFATKLPHSDTVLSTVCVVQMWFMQSNSLFFFGPLNTAQHQQPAAQQRVYCFIIFSSDF